jgi:hypothetical protein
VETGIKICATTLICLRISPDCRKRQLFRVKTLRADSRPYPKLTYARQVLIAAESQGLFDHLAVSRQLELEHGTFRYVG